MFNIFNAFCKDNVNFDSISFILFRKQMYMKKDII